MVDSVESMTMHGLLNTKMEIKFYLCTPSYDETFSFITVTLKCGDWSASLFGPFNPEDKAPGNN